MHTTLRSADNAAPFQVIGHSFINILSQLDESRSPLIVSGLLTARLKIRHSYTGLVMQYEWGPQVATMQLEPQF